MVAFNTTPTWLDFLIITGVFGPPLAAAAFMAVMACEVPRWVLAPLMFLVCFNAASDVWLKCLHYVAKWMAPS